ncbi:MAG TPA: DUF2155 domain-containing protein [Erythrobacter sp.]|nr:DUF2155 domain-containing protein [Erythrobacter sp.]
MRRLRPCAAAALALASCGQEPPAPKPVETALPEELATPADAPPPGAAEAAGIGSPMAERVATLGLLNKRNNSSQDLQLKPGESRRIGDIIVRLQACERTAPWEMQRETGAFVQVLVQDRGAQDFRRIFSGWLFKNSPSLNVVEHPVYDVWVKDCAMSFPGEEPAAPASRSSSS